jgi:hypothetical protein
MPRACRRSSSSATIRSCAAARVESRAESNANSTSDCSTTPARWIDTAPSIDTTGRSSGTTGKVSAELA